MSDRTPYEPRSEILSEPAAARLLARASELDAARGTGVEVADLRAAATEAGISSAAFDAALAELQRAEATPAPIARHSRGAGAGRWLATIAAVLLLLLVVARLTVSVNELPVVVEPMVEESFLLRCLTPAQAATLIRPVLDLPQNSVQSSPENAPGVLNVRATPQQLQRVRAMLDQHENSLTGVCVSGRTNG